MTKNKYPFPVTFTDANGTDNVQCYSDGYSLQLALRGIQLTGTSFNLLSFSEEDRQKALSVFVMDKFDMIEGLFCVQLPLYIRENNQMISGVLSLTFDYQNEKNDLTFAFKYRHQTYSSSGVFSFVEDVLIALQKLLPEGCHLHCCMSCRFSSYHPVGNNDFGALACFRLMKNDIIIVDDKHSLMDLWDKSIKENQHITVQETFVCAEYNQNTDSVWMYKSF